MYFDWEGFLDRHNVEYARTKNELLIKCPLCPDDELTNSKPHMSINVDGKGWKCWRDRGHRGGRPHRLIQALTGYSWEQMDALVGGTPDIPTNFYETVSRTLDPIQPISTSKTLALPEEFHPLTPLAASCASYNRYLLNRGFNHSMISGMYVRYGLHFCVRGPFKGRIIFPILYQDHLVTWTGRAISAEASLRYLTLSRDEAAGPITDYLLWYDQLAHSKADTVFICEGPFDALKLNELGRDVGAAATCFFTSSPSQRQIALLYELLPRFRHRVLLLDQNTTAIALRVASELNGLGVRRMELPATVKDPGELNRGEIFALAQRAKTL